MAHIAIDARKYFDYGIGSYIQNLVPALSQLNTAHSFTLFVSSRDWQEVELPPGWRKVRCDYPKYSVGEIAFLGRDARTAAIDLFHEPHYTLPAGLKGKSVVTVHDLIHLKLPQYFSFVQREYAKAMLGHAVRHAGAIIAVSQRTKADILEAFHVKEEKVSVIHNGVRPAFRKLPDAALVREFRIARGLERPFLLFVGNVKPHKNVPALLEAFALVHTRHPDYELVFAGGDCLGDASLKNLAEKLRISSRIRDLHQLGEPELVRAYNAAEVVVLPSFYEGFGFPALEAMACGTPAIVSGGGALPEIVGDAALVVQPATGESLANAIMNLLNDAKLRSSLIAKGASRAAEFSWKIVGEQTLAIYERVLEQCR